jgi:hypothetical protein
MHSRLAYYRCGYSGLAVGWPVARRDPARVPIYIWRARISTRLWPLLPARQTIPSSRRNRLGFALSRRRSASALTPPSRSPSISACRRRPPSPRRLEPAGAAQRYLGSIHRGARQTERGVSSNTRPYFDASTMSPLRNASRTASSFLASSSERYGDHPPSSSMSSTDTSAAYLPSRTNSTFVRVMASCVS